MWPCRGAFCASSTRPTVTLFQVWEETVSFEEILGSRNIGSMLGRCFLFQGRGIASDVYSWGYHHRRYDDPTTGSGPCVGPALLCLANQESE